MPRNIYLSIIIICAAGNLKAENIVKCDVSEIIKKARDMQPLKNPVFPLERIVREAKSDHSKDIVMDGLYYYVCIYPESQLAFVQQYGGIAGISVWYGPVTVQAKRYSACPVSQLHMERYDALDEKK